MVLTTPPTQPYPSFNPYGYRPTGKVEPANLAFSKRGSGMGRAQFGSSYVSGDHQRQVYEAQDSGETPRLYQCDTGCKTGLAGLILVGAGLLLTGAWK